MRVVLAHNNFTITGGAEVFYHEAGRILEQRGHPVAFMSACDDATHDTVWSTYFPRYQEYSKGNILNRIGNFSKMVYSQTAKNNMERLIRDFRPDIAHVFAVYVKLTPSILDACREARVPVVMSCNDYKHICPSYKMFHHGAVCEECKGGRFYKAVVNRCAKNSLVYSLASSIEAYVHGSMDIYRKNIHSFLFSSDFMANKTKEFWGSNSFRWRKLKNPFESRSFPLCEEYDDYFLFFGRLVDEKGVHVLLSAMREVPKAKLVIVGNGPLHDELQAQATSSSLSNVTFVGPKWGDELNDYLCRSRFVVVPSIWHENFPYVILQSFAFGKAVIGSDRGGIPEIVQDGRYGLVYPANDSCALAQRINYLWDNTSTAVNMGRAAKKYADEEFNDDAFYENLMSIYKEVCS